MSVSCLSCVNVSCLYCVMLILCLAYPVSCFSFVLLILFLAYTVSCLSCVLLIQCLDYPVSFLYCVLLILCLAYPVSCLSCVLLMLHDNETHAVLQADYISRHFPAQQILGSDWLSSADMMRALSGLVMVSMAATFTIQEIG